MPIMNILAQWQCSQFHLDHIHHGPPYSLVKHVSTHAHLLSLVKIIVSDIKCIIICLSFAVPTAPPRNFVLTNVTTNSVILSWDPPTYEQQNGVIRHYIIYLTELSGTDNNKELTSRSLSFILSELRPAFCYSVSVAAYTIGVGPTTANSEFCLLTAGCEKEQYG